MTPSEKCREAGLSGLAQLASITKTSQQTLINWHKNKPKLFRAVVLGAAEINKKERSS